jgi:hypothetical protein
MSRPLTEKIKSLGLETTEGYLGQARGRAFLWIEGRLVAGRIGHDMPYVILDFVHFDCEK